MTRVVLFGATGFTGRLLTNRLVARGLRPVLVGRSAERLQALASRFGDLETGVADVATPCALRAILEPGDVLASTVGPYARYGETAVAAAVDAGAHYLDCTGEAAFIRRVFETYGPRAEQAGVALLPSAGYSFAPGNLVAALALRDAGATARRVDVGYFFTGPVGGWSLLAGSTALSDGARATLVIADARAHGYRHGHLTLEPFAKHVRRFDIGGRRRAGISVGGTEHFTLPRIAPQLNEINVHLGWFRSATRALQVFAMLRPMLEHSTRLQSWMDRRTERALRQTGRGPGAAERARSGSLFVASTYNADGRPLTQSRLVGPNAFDLTAELMSFATNSLATGEVNVAGAVGPVDAFGIDTLAAAWPTSTPPTAR